MEQMDLKEQLAQLEADIRAVPVNKKQVLLRMMAIQAVLEDDDVEVPADVFSTVSSDIRKMALSAFIITLASSL